jgi:hypothetical protein
MPPHTGVTTTVLLSSSSCSSDTGAMTRLWITSLFE